MKKSLILTKYHIASLWNWRGVYLGRIVEPLAYFVFLVVGISGMLGTAHSGSYLSYAFTGIVCLLTFRAFGYASSDVANDRKWGVYAIFMMQGGKVWTYLASIFAVISLVFLVQVAAVSLAYLGLSFAGGTSVNGTALLSGTFIALLVVWGWVSLGAAVGALVNSYAARDMLATFTTLPVVLSAPLFYELSSAPTYLQLIARCNPLTYHVQWMRAPAAADIVYALLWVGTTTALARYALSRADRLSSER
ncbi:ABC transporter permease [Actinotignum timonense]|uniref:ABC transporter permease n=1 Tax=Actinotignum TaxID=1653174 RepID=UPI00254D723F|nr:ABC transporter permease [Actinotignum timonense]MDK6907429.1 ABC transporter permease [Actinotignum timonense]MDY5138301.1 ABC transporter permease [Actinotignum timonense]